MLQTKEIEQRFSRIEEAIGDASKACTGDAGISPDVRHFVDALDRESGRARQVLDSHDASLIRECIDEMEDLGDRAKRAAAVDVNTSPRIRKVIGHLHDTLSDLKHQLH